MLVFTYGTLRHGASNAADTSYGCKYVGPDYIRGTLFDVCWYPGFVTEGNTRIRGDVFEITEKHLKDLDCYEGYPHLYSRELVLTEEGRTVLVYTYNHRNASNEEIPSGDWMEYTDEIHTRITEGVN